ncbi:MAG: hypothetical protein AAFR61_10190 [Bacteroidota bacterium]
MKPLHSFLCLFGFLLLLSPLKATIITVDNSAASVAQYQDLQLAIDNATAGDTLHVLGSNASYGNVQLNKQLVLFGAGYNSPSQLNLNSLLSSLSLTGSSPTNSASGSIISGFEMNTLSWVSGASLHNITVERCRINNTLTMANNNASGWLIQHNILTNISIGDNPNCMIRNNIIQGFISNSDEATVVITQNLFTSSSGLGNTFSNIDNAIISNNIFYYGKAPRGADNCVFNNNLTYQTPNDTLAYANNSGSNNLEGIDPQFAQAASGGFQYSYDYRLLPGSPAIGAGGGNQDMGIYGGLMSFPLGGDVPYLTSPPPSIPQVIDFDILTPNMSQGGSLIFRVKARKQQ